MKKLLAYTLTGRTYTSETEFYDWKKIIGIDLDSWKDDVLNGNSAFKIIDSNDTIPNNYNDISSIINWNKFGQEFTNDYLVYKNQIKLLVEDIGWSNLNNDEKDLAIKYYAYSDSTSAVIYLMTVKGYTQQYSQYFLVQQWHKHHGNVMNTCKQRWYYVKMIVPMYLSFDDAEDLLNTVEPLVFAYNDMGRLGVNYGDKKDGVMDYIESTNAFAGQGLRENNYVLLQGNWDSFIQGMKNVFVEGIYTKYDDIIIN